MVIFTICLVIRLRAFSQFHIHCLWTDETHLNYNTPLNDLEDPLKLPDEPSNIYTHTPPFLYSPGTGHLNTTAYLPVRYIFVKWNRSEKEIGDKNNSWNSNGQVLSYQMSTKIFCSDSGRGMFVNGPRSAIITAPVFPRLVSDVIKKHHIRTDQFVVFCLIWTDLMCSCCWT